MTSVDLKDACYFISIAPEHHKYLKNIWKDQLYAFNCLPMSLTIEELPSYRTLNEDSSSTYISARR